MKTALTLILAAALAGCAANPPVAPEVVAAAEKPLICTDKAQCDLYWQRALFYINRYADFRVHTATTDLIQTYSSTNGSPRVSYNVSKEPRADGSIRLWVTTLCDNMFGCEPAIPVAQARFKTYVREGRRDAD